MTQSNLDAKIKRLIDVAYRHCNTSTAYPHLKNALDEFAGEIAEGLPLITERKDDEKK